MPYRRSESASRRLPRPLLSNGNSQLPKLGGLQSGIANSAGPRFKLAALEGRIPKAKQFEGERLVYRPKRTTKIAFSQTVTGSVKEYEFVSGVEFELIDTGHCSKDKLEYFLGV